MYKRVVLQTVEEESVLTPLEGNTYQIHVLPDKKIRLTPVVIEVPSLSRCPVILGGEQCGKSWGHEGKHCWVSGD